MTASLPARSRTTAGGFFLHHIESFRCDDSPEGCMNCTLFVNRIGNLFDFAKDHYDGGGILSSNTFETRFGGPGRNAGFDERVQTKYCKMLWTVASIVAARDSCLLWSGEGNPRQSIN